MIGLERERGRRREGRILTLFLLPGIGYGPLCKKSQPANTVLVPSRHSLLPPAVGPPQVKTATRTRLLLST